MMDGLPYTEAEIKAHCQTHLASVKSRFDDPEARFVVLPPKGAGARYAVKLAGGFQKPALNYERAFMEFLSSDSKYYRVPKIYAMFEDKKYAYLVMEYLEGPTMWQVVKEGTTQLSPKDANDIAVAFLELRNGGKRIQDLQKAGSLTPLEHWDPQGHMFSPDGDGGRLLLNQSDFVSFMTSRFKEAGMDMSAVSLDEWVLTHGDLTPRNLKRCTDGRIGILDYRTMFLAPTWWEFYALHLCGESNFWVGPLKEAMRRQRITAPATLVEALDAKWIPWFSAKGGAWAR